MRIVPTAMSSSLQRMTAWLCLAMTVLTGIVPARGFALCMEADGCVRIEFKAVDEDCDGCEDHGVEAPASDVLTAPDGSPSCPCVDLALPGPPGDPQATPDQRSPLERIALQRDLCAEARPAIVEPARFPNAPVRTAPRAQVLRPPDALTLIASVLLLV